MKKHLLVLTLTLLAGFSFSQQDTCSCQNGIGSIEGASPKNHYEFENGVIAILCGYELDEVYSEFDIFDCVLKGSISRYGALENCKIEFDNDTLKIIGLKYLPSGDNWTWQNIEMSIEYILTDGKMLISSGISPAFHQLTTSIPVEEQQEFLIYLLLNKDNGLQHDWVWDEIIGKLEVIALTGNEEAIDVMINLQEITNYQLDGAYMEQYRDALATLEWIK